MTRARIAAFLWIVLLAGCGLDIGDIGGGSDGGGAAPLDPDDHEGVVVSERLARDCADRSFVASLTLGRAVAFSGHELPAGTRVTFHEPLGCKPQDFNQIETIELPGGHVLEVPRASGPAVACTGRVEFAFGTHAVKACELAQAIETDAGRLEAGERFDFRRR